MCQSNVIRERERRGHPSRGGHLQRPATWNVVHMGIYTLSSSEYRREWRGVRPKT